MNLIELMKCQLVFDTLETELLKYSFSKGSPHSAFSRNPVDSARVRSTVRNLKHGSLKITNVKVTVKDKNKHIITFNSDNDRYYCIWDFAEGRYLSRSVNR